MYLTAIIDWYSRFIVGWALSDTLDTAPVLDALSRAIAAYGTPAIINSDQGCQFTSDAYIGFLKSNQIRQSMDGKARWVDNVIIIMQSENDIKDPFICGFKGYQHIESLTNEVVERLIDSIHIYDSNSIEIVFKFREEQERLFRLIEDI